MKLKLVVASMSVLGLVSCPAFAATAKHKHHHKMKHHHTVVAHHEYKDMGALPVPVMETCPKVDLYTNIMDAMSHNTNRAKPTVHCNDPLSLAGGINFDAHWGNRRMGYMGENVNRLSVNDAYLNVYGNVNEWVKALLSGSYSSTSGVLNGDQIPSIDESNVPQPGVYSNAYQNRTFTLEQAVIRIGNFEQTPFFLNLGKQFVDFGRYDIHPITRSMTQVMTETRRTAAELGFITCAGLHGSVFSFNNPLTLTSNGHAQPNYGASIGYDQINDQLGFDLGAGYLYDFTGVNDIAYAVTTNNTAGLASSSTSGSENTRVHAGSLYADVNSGPFTLGARYVQAMNRFNVLDVPKNASLAQGAKPWSADIKAGYGFNAWNKNQNIYLGYQASQDAVFLYLPKSRWLAGYNMDVWKNTNVGVEVARDNSYSISQGGTGTSSNTVALRVGVKFG